MHVIGYHSDNSNDENIDCFVAESVWPTQAKSVACSSLKPIHKNQQEDMKFTCKSVALVCNKEQLHALFDAEAGISIYSLF
jgi:hypothetical protein